MKPWKQVLILVLAGGAFFLWQYLEWQHADEAEWCGKIPPAKAGGFGLRLKTGSFGPSAN